MKLGLAFSGGKDSLACMFLNKYRANEITVFWVNTGKTYPETLKMVEIAKSIYQNFVEIKSFREDQNIKEGLPSDVVPINSTRFASMFTGSTGQRIQSYLGCCFENISKPLIDAAKNYGITHMIRGQRNDEKFKSPITDGQCLDEITYIHPIENWTELQVYEYLKKHMDIPDHLHIKHSSLDCYDCTAYVKESKDRIEYTEKYHPVLFQKYLSRFNSLKEAISKEWVYD